MMKMFQDLSKKIDTLAPQQTQQNIKFVTENPNKKSIQSTLRQGSLGVAIVGHMAAVTTGVTNVHKENQDISSTLLSKIVWEEVLMGCWESTDS